MVAPPYFLQAPSHSWPSLGPHLGVSPKPLPAPRETRWAVARKEQSKQGSVPRPLPKLFTQRL